MQVITANLRFDTPLKQMKADLRRALKTGAGVVALQEANAAQARALRRLANSLGYGIHIVSDAPIIYDKSKYRIKSANFRELMNAGHGPKGNTRRVKASWVALEDRKSGNLNVVTNVHLAVKSRRPYKHKVQRRQLVDLQRDLMNRFGKNAHYFLAGDLNTRQASDFAGLKKLGFNFPKAPRDTGPHGGKIDWIGSTAQRRGSGRVLGNTFSDHNFYAARFKTWERRGKKRGGLDVPRRGGSGPKKITKRGVEGVIVKNGKAYVPLWKAKRLDSKIKPDTNLANGKKGVRLWRYKKLQDRERKERNNKNGTSWGRRHSEKKSAFDEMSAFLEDMGLNSLKGFLRDLITDGETDAASLQLHLQDTKEWKKRFAGNEQLKNKGLPVLSTQEYLAVEGQYAQIMKNYGLPSGFYDNPSDFAKFIGNSVSASELQSRVAAYADVAQRTDAGTKQMLQRMGMDDGDVLAYVMDPKRAAPLIQQKYQQVLIGAAARNAGVDAKLSTSRRLASQGVTEQEAKQGYGIISEGLGTMSKLGKIHGERYGLGDFEEEVFDGDGRATNKRKRLASAERASFSGSSGSSGLSKRTSGSY